MLFLSDFKPFGLLPTILSGRELYSALIKLTCPSWFVSIVKMSSRRNLYQSADAIYKMFLLHVLDDLEKEGWDKGLDSKWPYFGHIISLLQIILHSKCPPKFPSNSRIRTGILKIVFWSQYWENIIVKTHIPLKGWTR